MGTVIQTPTSYWKKDGENYITTIKDLLIKSDILIMVDDATPASASNAGRPRYRKIGNNTYFDVCMQVGASSYEWVNITQANY